MGEYSDELNRIEHTLNEIKLLLDRMHFAVLQTRDNSQKILDEIAKLKK